MYPRNLSNRALISLILFLLLTTLLAPRFTAFADDARPSQPGIQMLHSNSSGLQFQLNTAAFQIDKDGNIHVSGLEQKVNEPGAPALPYYSTYIALPPQAEVSVTVTESGLSQHDAIHIQPAAQEQLWAEVDQSGQLSANPETITELEPLITADEAVYKIDAPFPRARFELSEPLYLRDLRLVELKLFPLRYNPSRESLTQATNMSVQLSFSGTNFEDLTPSPGFVDNQAESLRENVLNFEQAQTWRSLPADQKNTVQATDLPLGVSTFKILIDQDGIYEISAAELANSGMTLPAAPNTLQMMHRGQPVAFQFLDSDADNLFFNPADKIRFYGWAFDGSRYEQMYVNDNVFWLWAGGSANNIPIVPNEAPSGNVVTNFVDSVTRQDKLDNFSGWSVNWENDPTIWHMDLITADSGTTATQAYDVELPDPDPSAAGNSVLVELTTKLSPFAFAPPTYTAKTFLNDSVEFGQEVWNDHRNLNVVKTFPTSEFKQSGDAGYPTNQVKVALSSDSTGAVSVQLTRIAVEYTRLLKAVGDQLIFSRVPSGHDDFQVSGFGNGDPSSVIVWDITDRHMPEQIQMQSSNITGAGADHSYHISRTHDQNGQFIATNTANMLAVKEISQYVPQALDPVSRQGNWLAITHGSMRDAAEKLAAYRRSEMSAWVVDIEDVTNQIGYGFQTPETIRQFLIHAVSTWNIGPPKYVTIFGDATRNPVMKGCSSCGPGTWDETTPTWVVTDFAFVDRWNGMVPSDFNMSLLFGDDLVADVNIGRMPANSLAEANNMVQKVILFENLRRGTLSDRQKHFLFIADNQDRGGDFCTENEVTGGYIPAYSAALDMSFTQEHLCLEEPVDTNTPLLREDMNFQINILTTPVVNYRGHGATRTWATGTTILTADETDFWQNTGLPVVILSADCLDGYFINTQNSSLGETFTRLDNRGSAAHWSSSGFGLSVEHSVLHQGFYEGLFEHGQTRIGDAIQYSKIQYGQGHHYFSELITFVLLGDPAMNLFPSNPTAIERPLALQAAGISSAPVEQFAAIFALILLLTAVTIWRIKIVPLRRTR